MAFETAVSTSIDDLISKLMTFATGNGWTQDNLDTGANKASLSKNGVFVHFQWNETVDGGTLAIYQALGFTAAGTDVWLHPDDSGSGEPSTTASEFDTERCVNKLEGPHTKYWFFEQDSGPAYIHIVVEYEAGLYRHFGFGEISKIGDWLGGEYCYGHFWGQIAADIDNPRDTVHSVGLEGAYTATVFGATMHVEDIAGEPDGDTKWGLFTDETGSPGNDRAAVARLILMGGWRGGPWLQSFGGFRMSQLNAFKPLIPVGVWYNDDSDSPDIIRILGFQADVAMINIGNLDPKQEFTIGSDTWIVFPLVRKQHLEVNTEESWNAGVAYKKVTA